MVLPSAFQALQPSITHSRDESRGPSVAPARGSRGISPRPKPLEGKKKRIAVMTSGGDSPGMNGAVRAVVRASIDLGCQAYAVYEGYEGLVNGGDMIKEMEWSSVRGWLSEGGTLIGTARCAAFRERPGRLQAAKNLVTAGIDALVVVGGDGSLTGADRFRDEWPGLLQELVEKKELKLEQIKAYPTLNIAGMVGSIDNDMAMTDATIGCYSSLGKICEMVDSIDSTASSHQRAFVIEVMGRHCGWLALMAGVATGADFIFLPEKPPSEHWQEDMCSTVKKHRSLGKRKTIVIMAEGAHDLNLQKVLPQTVVDLLKNIGLDTRLTVLGHVQRGGAACAYDRILATIQGVEAVHAVLEADSETPSPMIAMDENKIVRKPLVDAVKATQDVTEAIKAKRFDDAMKLRGNEFGEYYQAFEFTNETENPRPLPDDSRKMRIAIIHVGAPAGGVSAATRSCVAYCLSRGHTPIAIHNGFPGLCRHHDDKPIGSVREVKWVDADGWVNKGGSEIGTNRALPSEDMQTTAYCFGLYKFDAIFIIGGFEAFTSLSELRKARETYPEFRIPMVLLPATISNNVPGSEYSVGSDTALNALGYYNDTLRQSASATRRRVFTVETQGGRSGYLATMGGLAVGATAVYTPEEGIDLPTLARDIEHLRGSFAEDRGQNRAGKLILVNEHANATYSAKLISEMIREEAKGRFESRYAIPGHFQQGGTPSPMDRTRAVRLAVKCMEFLETYSDKSQRPVSLDDDRSMSVIGVKGASVVFTPMKKLEEEDTNWKDRRPKEEAWRDFTEVVDTLSGRPRGDKPSRS